MHKLIVETPAAANRPKLRRSAEIIVALIALAAFTGCQSSEALLDAPAKPSAISSQTAASSQTTNSQVEAIQNNAWTSQAVNQAISQAMTQAADTNQMIVLREGDVLKITFPGSPSLNTVQTIRKDGIISMPLIGEIKAAGMTPDELDQKLIELYAPQLTTKQISVEVQSALFPIYVTGAVLRPGKIMSDHSITALEAVMEAGGFDYTKADMKHVVVIRKEAGGTKNYILNLKAVIDGKTRTPFYLKPSDIIFVQEKFNWF